jgi:alpha-ketoglutarate-dependent taurine dioxygenase
MSKILETLVIDKKKTWTKNLSGNSNEFLVDLDDNVIGELLQKRDLLDQHNIQHFTHLKTQIQHIKQAILIQGCGFCVINGTNFTAFDKHELSNIHILISKIFGELLIQNKQGEQTVEVKDLGKTLSTGGRYHHTKEGGSYHTDGCHIFENPPDYVGLLCLNPAKNGGVSKFISAYTIHNKLQEDKNLLRILYEKFYMDKRNENQADEIPTQFVPIFTYNNGKLNCRCCQRELIDSGHEKMNKPLTEYQKNALDNLDKLLANENFAVSYLLKKGDMMYSNNKWLIHDRTDFEDSDDENLKRSLLRTWIRERDNN